MFTVFWEATVPEMSNEFLLLTATHSLAAVFWLLSALSAFAGYRGFNQSVDLGWTLAFAAIAGVRAGDAYVAYRYMEMVEEAPSVPAIVETASFYGLRLAALEIAAAIGVFYLFRARRRVF